MQQNRDTGRLPAVALAAVGPAMATALVDHFAGTSLGHGGLWELVAGVWLIVKGFTPPTRTTLRPPTTAQP